MLYLLIFIIGTAIGSFLNVVICRLPEKKTIVKGRSECPHCKAVLGLKDLIPILSFFVLKGKCGKCKKKISWQYPLVELATGLLFVFLAYFYNIGESFANPLFYRDLVFVSALVVIFMTDLRFYLIFDSVTFPMMVFAFAINVFILSNSSNWLEVIGYLVLAGLVGGGFFYIQHFISKGKWIGGGDIRLGVLMGFMLGWPNIIVGIFFAYIIGAFVSIILLTGQKKKMKSQVPFGVFLAIGTLIALLWGEGIMTWYLGLMI